LQITSEDISAIARIVQELCGLTLDATKGYLIESRLATIATAAGCATFQDLAQKARLPSNQTLRHEIIDAITTQETLFFRDDSPFAALQHKALPDLIDGKARTAFPKRLRIWSAACSTGQEPYSLAMTLSEILPAVATWDINILGTDISNAAIRQASMGQYAKHEIQRGMKTPLLTKYFREESAGWRIKDELRGMVTFARRNLLEPFANLGPFDVIFCRNVAIYFNAETRRNLFLRLAERLTPTGYLFVGSSECLTDLGPQFVPQHHCRGTYYQPHKPAAAAPPATAPAAAPAFSASAAVRFPQSPAFALQR
jgi:chemotaxis protein methyltransferase CheR